MYLLFHYTNVIEIGFKTLLSSVFVLLAKRNMEDKFHDNTLREKPQTKMILDTVNEKPGNDGWLEHSGFSLKRRNSVRSEYSNPVVWRMDFYNKISIVQGFSWQHFKIKWVVCSTFSLEFLRSVTNTSQEQHMIEFYWYSKLVNYRGNGLMVCSIVVCSLWFVVLLIVAARHEFVLCTTTTTPHSEFVVNIFRTGLHSTVALRKWEQLYITAIQDATTGITELKNLQVFSVEVSIDILEDTHAMTEHYRLVDNFKGYTKIHFLKLQEKMKDKKVKREDITPINTLAKRYFLKFIIWFILTWPFGLGAAALVAWSSETTTVAHFDCSGKSRHYMSCHVIG